MWNIAKNTGRPLHHSLPDVWQWPHTLTQVVALRQRYDSLLELAEPPPEEHYDYPHLIRQHIERLYPSTKKGNSGTLEINVDDVEE